MLETVPRAAQLSVERPGPVNSTNLPTTERLRRISATCRDKSVAVTPGRMALVTRIPITFGKLIGTGSPTMAACPSSPPTPQPSTPMALIIGVWLSVATMSSGWSRRSPFAARLSQTTWANASMFIW
ncbi:hypothetical protein D3C80_1508520 [compost metagenome]